MSIKANYEALKDINLDLFYAVRLYAYEIQLQGNCKKEVIDYCKEQFKAEFTLTHNDNWLCADIFITEDVKISITLTMK